MPKISTGQIVAANVYIQGNSMLGRASKVDLPDVELLMNDHMALGMVGELELPVGFKKMEGSIDWNNFYQDVATLVTNPFSPLEMQLRANVETWDSSGRSAQTPMVVFMTVIFKTWSLGKYEPRKKAEFPSKFSATYFRQNIGGVDVLEIDMFANVYKVNGIDQLTTFRSNIGG